MYICMNLPDRIKRTHKEKLSENINFGTQKNYASTT